MVTKVRAVVIHMQGDREVAAGEMTVLGDGEPQDMLTALELAEEVAMQEPGALPKLLPESRYMRLFIDEDWPDFQGQLMVVKLRGSGSMADYLLLRQVAIRTAVRRMKDIVRVVTDHSVYDVPTVAPQAYDGPALTRPGYQAVVSGRQRPDPEVSPL